MQLMQRNMEMQLQLKHLSGFHPTLLIYHVGTGKVLECS